MELIYRKAELCDAKPVFDSCGGFHTSMLASRYVDFVRNAVNVMIRQKIFQWDEIYPTYDDFERDIKKRRGVCRGNCGKPAYAPYKSKRF